MESCIPAGICGDLMYLLRLYLLVCKAQLFAHLGEAGVTHIVTYQIVRFAIIMDLIRIKASIPDTLHTRYYVRASHRFGNSSLSQNYLL